MILLTRVPPRSRRGVLAGAVRRNARLRGRRLPPTGPDAVVSSLVRGLKLLGRPFELNPRATGRANTLGVLSDLDALAHGIEWKRSASGRRLIAGPNLVVLPSDAPDLMSSPQIDLCVVPSEWVSNVYSEDCPALAGRLAVWPAGVDPSYWAPVASRPAGTRRAAVYRKHVHGQLNVTDAEVAAALSALRSAGFETAFAEYGRHTPGTYRDLLRRSDVLVFFSPTESQCIALAEAWATGVPTLVWARGTHVYRGRTYRTSSAPYLSPSTGAAFEDANGLRDLLEDWENLHAAFRPRAWVLQNMTDELSARSYWEMAHGAR